jgi:C1A family cysteine protease
MKHLYAKTLVAALALMVLAACSPGSAEPDLLDSQNTYGEPSDPLPAGAIVVSPEEFKQKARQGKVRILKRKQLEANTTNHRNRKNRQQQELQTLLQQTPNLAKVLAPPVLSDTVKPSGDGNYLLTVQTAEGAKEVVTMGQETLTAELVEGGKRFVSRRNQGQLYRKMYNLIPAEARKKFVAPANLEQLSDGQLHQQNLALSGEVAKVPNIGATPVVGINLPNLSDPNQEVRKGKGSDRTTCNQVLSTSGILANFDWPLKEYTTSVKDQQGRGTCWSFAVTAGVEALVAVKHGKMVNLSEQMLINRYHDIWDPSEDDYGDGGNSDVALANMDQDDFVLPYENVWNYNPSLTRTEDGTNRRYTRSCDNYTELCSDTNHQSGRYCTPNPLGGTVCYNSRPSYEDNEGYEMTDHDVLWATSQDSGFNVWRLASLGLLQQYLTSKNPVILRFPVPDSFRNPSNGFVSYSGSREATSGSHAILATGFITNEELAQKLPSAPPGAGGGYFIIKNSWGSCWGDAGYAYLPYYWVVEYVYEADALDTVR